MKWVLITPKLGDIVRVNVGNIYHYGIYVDDSEVIQFGRTPVNKNMLIKDDVRVISTDIEEFLCGNFLEVAEMTVVDRIKAKKPREIVNIARSRLGEGGYNILYNNCEHFVYECVFGEKKCSQIDGVRDFVKRIPKTDVYIYEIFENVKIEKINNRDRQKEIENVSNIKVKREKYLSWLLLQKALKRSFDLDIDKIGICKNKNGKWESKEIYFSISHSDKYVAVAVSNKQVGVDIESVDKISDGVKLLSKIASLSEANTIPSKENLLLLWTKKESIFKRTGEGSFVPKSVDTTKEPSESRIVDSETLLSISSTNMDNVSYYSVKDFDSFTVELEKYQKRG